MTVTGAFKVLVAALSLPQSTAARVYVLKLPQNPTLPAVRLQRVSDVGTMQLRGPDRLRRARIQVNSIGLSGDLALTIDAAISQSLIGYNGIVSDVYIHLIQDVNLGDEEFEADELQQFNVRSDYFVEYHKVAA